MAAPLLAAALALSLAAGKGPAFTAVLDPGHGGELTGAVSPQGDLEKDLTLQIARRVKKRLEAMGGRVVLTRAADARVPLANRAAVANALEADLFVSIHLNSMPTEASRRTSSGMWSTAGTMWFGNQGEGCGQGPRTRGRRRGRSARSRSEGTGSGGSVVRAGKRRGEESASSRPRA